MKMYKSCLLIVSLSALMIFLTTGTAVSRDFHVLGPWEDIQIYLDRCESGDRVIVPNHDNPYVGNFVIQAGVGLIGAPDGDFDPRPKLRPANLDLPVVTMETSSLVSDSTKLYQFDIGEGKNHGIYITGDGEGDVWNNHIKRNAAVHGAGLLCVGSGKLRLRINYFVCNNADKDGGGVCLKGSAAAYLEGNWFNSNDAGDNGGGLSISGKIRCFSNDDMFEGNTAEYGGGIAINRAGRIIRLNDTRFRWNNAGEDGGGIYLNQVLDCEIQGGEFLTNQAVQRGGGIYVERSLPIIGPCRFNANSAYNGGAVFALDSPVSIVECDFENNTVQKSGAGVMLSDLEPGWEADPEIARNTFFKNIACADGGGICLTRVPKAIIQNNVLDRNEAGQGWGISVGSKSSVFLVNNTFAHHGHGMMKIRDYPEAVYLADSNTASTVANNIIAGYHLGIAGNNCNWSFIGFNDFFRVRTPLERVPDSGANRFDVDPSFVTFEFGQEFAYDLHIRKDSEAIDTAHPILAPEFDRDSHRRLLGPDRGAYEFGIQNLNWHR